MLNLMRFRDVADYKANPELTPEVPISGAEVMFLGDGGEFLIGPEEERWDLVMMIRQSSAQSFLAFSSHQDYMAGIGHRTAAIEDSRLLPMTELTIPN